MTRTTYPTDVQRQTVEECCAVLHDAVGHPKAWHSMPDDYRATQRLAVHALLTYLGMMGSADDRKS